MRVVKCKNQHFFDAETYTLCPHCNEEAIDGAGGKRVEEKKGFWGKKKEKTENVKSEPVSMTRDDNSGATTSLFGSADPFVHGAERYEQKQDQWEEKAVTKQEEKNSFAETSTFDPDKTQSFFSVQANASREPEIQSAPTRTEETGPEQTSGINTSTLSREIQNISASSDGKTIGFFNATMNRINTGETSAQPTAPASDSPVERGTENSGASAVVNHQRNGEPVVGWLVCVKGPHFGESFCLAMGKNTIGRGNDNNISIYKDGSVSRVKHATLVFEPKKKNFFIQPGDSSGLTYLNDEYITENTKLSARDVIEIGVSDFMFIPLCGEDFSWEDYL